MPGVMFADPVTKAPAVVREIYDEARRCMTINAYTSAVLCCRKVLMNLAHSHGAVEGASFKELAGGGIVIVLNPILRTDAMKELARMKQVKKMRVRFAGTSNSALFKSDGYGVKGIVNVMKDFKAPYLDMTVSMGRTRGYLDISSAIPFVRQLIGVSHGADKAVDKIELTGTNEDDERTVLDLLEFKMVETVDVKASITRRLFYTERKAAVLDAWNSKKQEIAGLLSN